MIRQFRDSDAAPVDRLAVAAFMEHSDSYTDWPGLCRRLSQMSGHAAEGEILVAEDAEAVCGAVLYVPPDRPRPAHFDQSWALIRMLVVDPERRGAGFGRALVAACLDNARRDGATTIALHTSPMMRVALTIYHRLGFGFVRSAPANFGAPCSILAKRLDLLTSRSA